MDLCPVTVRVLFNGSQLYTNYKTKSVDGLSAVFLLQWTAGDLTNLVGSILTHQLPMQIVIAAYMLSVDLCLCAQFWGTLSS